MNRKASTFLLVAFLLYTQFWVSWGKGWWNKASNTAKAGANKAMDTVKSGANKAIDKVKAGANWVSGAMKGTGDMRKAYSDMKEANWKNSDKYFHARGNYDAAKHGSGGAYAAKVISNAREFVDRYVKGDSAADSAADQEANKWGRSGGDPNKYRPKGLPEKY